MEKSITRVAEMERHIQAWDQSGLSKKKYSEEAGIPYHTFLYWIGRLSPQPQQDGSFRELSLPAAPQASGQIEIEYPSGVRLRLSSHFSATYIKALL